MNGSKSDDSEGEERKAKAKSECGLSHALGLNSRISQKASMATTADAGMVRIQAHTMRARNSPAHGRETVGSSDTDNGAGDGVGGADRNSGQCGAE